jgi:hydrogenase nickel incorporation protein HypA/HybF
MHEMSYCEGVVQAVERRAAGRPVAHVKVRIGTVHRVVADAFAQSFEMAAAGGVAAGATTEVVTVPVHGSCRTCRNEFMSDEPSPACPACGGFDVGTEGGDEVMLESITYRSEPAEHADEVVPEHTHRHEHDAVGADAAAGRA